MTEDARSVEEIVKISYDISGADGQAHHYLIELDNRSARLLNKPPATPPCWTRLDVCQCSNCPLDVETHPYCPLALQVSQVVDDWSGAFSFQDVEYTVTTTGSVKDVVVVEAEPKGIFEKVSIEAARKFKYKPRVVNGEPIEVQGVRNRFLYKLDD